MTAPLTAHQIKRIRRAGVHGLGRIARQDRYWSTAALREMLERVEALSQETPTEAVDAALAALGVLERLEDPSADLGAKAMVAYATALRAAGRVREAITVYDSVLETPGLTATGLCMVLQRLSVALIADGRTEEGLAKLERAFEQDSRCTTNLALRGWARMVTGEFEAALEDCLAVLERTDLEAEPRLYISTAVNAANVLSFEATFETPQPILLRLAEVIARCRQSLPTGGSGYYRTKRVRLVISRAEALLLIRFGELPRALAILRRTVKGLSDQHPDDALYASADLVCLYAKLGQASRAAEACRTTLDLLQRTPFPINPTARALVRSAIRRGHVSSDQGIEIRAVIRPL